MTSLTTTRNGSWFATSGEGIARIWDADSGEQRAQFPDGRISALALAPDGSWLATGSPDDGSVLIWDVAAGQVRQRLGDDGRFPWQPVAVAPAGTWLAASRNNVVRIWDPATGEQRHELTVGWVQALAVPANGTWLAVAGGHRDRIAIWDVVDAGIRRQLPGHGGEVRAMAAAPDGTWLATAGYGPSVWIWDVANGRQRRRIAGQGGGVTAMAVDPGGTRLATVGEDRTVRIWEVDSGECLAVMRVDASLTACAWAGDGRFLIVAGDAGLYRFEAVLTSGEGSTSTAPGPSGVDGPKSSA